MSTPFVVELPSAIRPLLEAEAREHGFANVADYVAALVHANAPSELEDPDLEKAIQEGIDSGEGRVVDESFWQDLRREALNVADSPDGA